MPLSSCQLLSSWNAKSYFSFLKLFQSHFMPKSFFWLVSTQASQCISYTAILILLRVFIIACPHVLPRYLVLTPCIKHTFVMPFLKHLFCNLVQAHPKTINWCSTPKLCGEDTTPPKSSNPNSKAHTHFEFFKQSHYVTRYAIQCQKTIDYFSFSFFTRGTVLGPKSQSVLIWNTGLSTSYFHRAILPSMECKCTQVQT